MCVCVCVCVCVCMSVCVCGGGGGGIWCMLPNISYSICIPTYSVYIVLLYMYAYVFSVHSCPTTCSQSTSLFFLQLQQHRPVPLCLLFPMPQAVSGISEPPRTSCTSAGMVTRCMAGTTASAMDRESGSEHHLYAAFLLVSSVLVRSESVGEKWG